MEGQKESEKHFKYLLLIFGHIIKGFLKFYLDFLINLVMKGINMAFWGLGRSTHLCNPGLNMMKRYVNMYKEKVL